MNQIFQEFHCEQSFDTQIGVNFLNANSFYLLMFEEIVLPCEILKKSIKFAQQYITSQKEDIVIMVKESQKIHFEEIAQINYCGIENIMYVQDVQKESIQYTKNVLIDSQKIYNLFS